jgi:hypothetical protein
MSRVGHVVSMPSLNNKMINACKLSVSLKERDLMKDLSIDGGVLLIKIEVKCEDFEWIHLNQGRVYWWSVVNRVLNLFVA